MSQISNTPSSDMFKSDPTLFDVENIRRDFPILQRKVHGKPLVWLDNAATTQKPQAVIDRMMHYYEHENSNFHRGTHTMAEKADDAYEGAREGSQFSGCRFSAGDRIRSRHHRGHQPACCGLQ